MAKTFYADLIRLLKSAGYIQIEGGKGSHEKWRNAQGKTLIIPRNLYKRHLANAILKDAGLPKAF